MGKDRDRSKDRKKKDKKDSDSEDDRKKKKDKEKSKTKTDDDGDKDKDVDKGKDSEPPKNFLKPSLSPDRPSKTNEAANTASTDEAPARKTRWSKAHSKSRSLS